MTGAFAEDALVEVIFIAGSPSELDGAAAVLDAAEVEFETRKAAFIKSFLGGSVYEGIAFYVLAGQAAFARGELARSGLERGIVTTDPSGLTPIRELPLA